VSLRFFDPGKFESDIFSVDVRGLGRGKGVEVIDRSSVLNDVEIVGPIRDRCIELLRIIDGKRPLTGKAQLALQKEHDRWKKSAHDIQKLGNDREAQVAGMESELLHWRKDSQKREKLNRDYEAKLANDESIIRSWRNHSDKLAAKVNKLELENKQLRKKIENAAEEEELAIEKMEEILEMINSSANTTFEYLIDAVEFLLEVG
jgi:hypothetical protein